MKFKDTTLFEYSMMVHDIWADKYTELFSKVFVTLVYLFLLLVLGIIFLIPELLRKNEDD